MTPVYTLTVDGVPFSYTSEAAPPIGELVLLDASAASGRVVRVSDGPRVYVREPAGEGAS